MKHPDNLLTRHRKLFLICLLTATFLLSSVASRSRLEEEAIVTTLPVTSVLTSTSDAVTAYSEQREDEQQQELSALSALATLETLDDATRRSAAGQLQDLVANRTSQQAIEKALAGTALAPCAAIVSGGSVTIVTAAQDVSAQDSALVLYLAAAHAGVGPEDVRIITAE